jgi:hypothetical protein
MESVSGRLELANFFGISVIGFFNTEGMPSPSEARSLCGLAALGVSEFFFVFSVLFSIFFSRK